MTTTPTPAGQTFQVTSLDRASQPAAFSLVFNREVFPARSGWDARVLVFDAASREVGELHLDRLDGESEWHVSAEFRAGCSMPRFMNGLFSRCTIPTRPAPALADKLNDFVALHPENPAAAS